MESTAKFKHHPLLPYCTGQEKLLQHYSKQAQWHYEQSLLFAQYAWSVNEKLIALRTQSKDPCCCETTEGGEVTDDICCLNDVVAGERSCSCPDNLNDKKESPTTTHCNNFMGVCENNTLSKDSCMDLDINTSGTTFPATTNNNIDATTVKLRRKKKKRRCKSNLMKKRDDEEIATEEDNMEVDPAFREFLRQSAQFRMERDAAKKASKKNDNNNSGMVDAESEECIEYVDVMCKGPEGTILPPTAQNREALYRERYGARGTTLLSMETALQWQFNKFCDAMRPKPWPSIPLNM